MSSFILVYLMTALGQDWELVFKLVCQRLAILVIWKNQKLVKLALTELELDCTQNYLVYFKSTNQVVTYVVVGKLELWPQLKFGLVTTEDMKADISIVGSDFVHSLGSLKQFKPVLVTQEKMLLHVNVVGSDFVNMLGQQPYLKSVITKNWDSLMDIKLVGHRGV